MYRFSFLAPLFLAASVFISAHLFVEAEEAPIPMSDQKDDVIAAFSVRFNYGGGQRGHRFHRGRGRAYRHGGMYRKNYNYVQPYRYSNYYYDPYTGYYYYSTPNSYQYYPYNYSYPQGGSGIYFYYSK